MSGENHMNGFWGEVTGADFCEYNYNTSFYVGEFFSTLTALLTFVALGLAYKYAMKSLFPQGVPMTLAFMLLARAINLAFAASQHATLNSFASNAQEATLAIGIWFMVYIFIRWGQPNEVPVQAVIIWGASVGILQMFSVFKVILPWGLGIVPWSPVTSLFALMYVSMMAQSVSTRFLVLSSGLFVVAEVFFGITDVQNGLCDYIHGYQLHSIGHLFGCGSEWCMAMWCFSLKLEFDNVPLSITWNKWYIPYATIQSDESNSKLISPLNAKGNYQTFQNNEPKELKPLCSLSPDELFSQLI